MLPCFQGLLWLFQPDPCIVYNLFLIYQSLASLISPQIASSSLYLPHSFMGFHTWKWVLMDWDLRCRPWKWDLPDELCSTANGIIGALCHWKSSRHILMASHLGPLLLPYKGDDSMCCLLLCPLRRCTFSTVF